MPLYLRCCAMLRLAPPRTLFILDSRRDSAALFLRRRCGRTLGLRRWRGQARGRLRDVQSEKYAKLAQKLGLLSPFIAVFSQS